MEGRSADSGWMLKIVELRVDLAGFSHLALMIRRFFCGNICLLRVLSMQMHTFFRIFWFTDSLRTTPGWHCVSTSLPARQMHVFITTIHNRLRGHDMDVLDLAWSKLDNLLASCSIDNKILIWEPNGNSILLPRHELKGHKNWVKVCVNAEKLVMRKK